MDEEMMKNMGAEMDPVSGNEIPPGVGAENVRDDIDAKLSEGEYVMPADVVKFFGMAHFEKMIKKAKEGMAEFEEEGRIGGKAVDEAITEMDEEEDGMMEMSEGGYTLGSDVMALDGYATGGLVEGTDYDAIIDRVKAAAGKDPSIANMLKAKGIFIEAPAPNSMDQQMSMMSGAVPTQAAPPQLEGKADASAYAEGGFATGDYNPAKYESSFNPYAYTPGFYKGEGGPTGTGLGSKPVAPTKCPTGFVLDPATNTCVPAGSTATAPQQESRDRDQNRGESLGAGAGGASNTSWMDKYNYGDPDVLYEQTMTSLGAGEAEGEGPKTLVDSLLGIGKNILAGGIIGKFMSTTNVAQTMANSLALKEMGRDDLAKKVEDQAGIYVKDNGLTNVPSTWRDGDQLFGKIQSEGRITYDPNAAKPTATTSTGRQDQQLNSVGSPTSQSEADRIVQDNQDRGSTQSWKSSGGVGYERSTGQNSAGQNVTVDRATGSTAPTQTARPVSRPTSSTPSESYDQKISRGGGFAKGGLVKRPTKK
jgi:hypothetical protein